MEENQTTAVPNNGASNAADFQPTTKSPQTAPIADVQQQNGLEGTTNSQEFLNDNKAAQISVPNNPAPAQAQAKADITGMVVIAAIAIIVGVVLFKLSNKMPNKKKVSKTTETKVEEPAQEEVRQDEPSTSDEVSDNAETEEKTPVEEQAATPKKAATKKKSSKKSKRRNR